MYIISKFKDFYDKNASIYGVDKRIVLDRNAKLPSTVELRVADERVTRPFSSYDKIFGGSITDEIKAIHGGYFRVLVVCGKQYLITESVDYNYEHGGKRELGRAIPSPELQNILGRAFGMGSWSSQHKEWVQDMSGYEKEFIANEKKYLIELSKKVKSPIFIIENVGFGQNDKVEFYIDECVPNLSEIKGFARLYGSDLLYQDVSYYVANILNESPDMQPVGRPPMTDKEKIKSHGFDNKKSFRHRIV